jgi:hypothetical protein
MPSKFATAYVVQNTKHDFKALRDLCDEIVFLTHGYELEEQLPEIIATGLASFVPSTDILVPVGNVYPNMLAGMVAKDLCRTWGKLSVGLYRDKAYHVNSIPVMELTCDD